MATELTPACVWKISDELVGALDGRFGEPVDTYVNGSQVWLRDDGPGGVTLEWRLHPVSGYKRPEGMETDEVFSLIALAIGRGEAPAIEPAKLWDGLEAFAAYDDELEPATLTASCLESLGIAPDASGLVDHVHIGDEWERSRGAVSIIELLMRQLSS